MKATAKPRLPGLVGNAGWSVVKAAWKSGPSAGNEGSAIISFTDFAFARWRDLPGSWLAAMRLRSAWPQLQGAVGLMLWAKPLRRRSGAISIWESDADLQRFISSPDHVAIMRSYRTRMSGSAATWSTQRVDRREVLAEARRRLAS